MSSTIATSQPTGTASIVHPLANSAFSASGASGLYDRARPSYPSPALSDIFSLLPNSRPVNIVEIGSGTGIFTRMLIKPPKDVNTNGVKIGLLLAVEPSSGMREGFENGMAKAGVEVGGEKVVNVVDGRFDSVPVEDGWADVVVIAQAFHWAHGNYAAAIRNFARIIKPNGHLLLIWNMEDRDSEASPWVGHLRDTYEKFEQGTPQCRHGWWKAIFDLPEFHEAFGTREDVILKTYKRNLPTTEDSVVDRVLSKSYITDLDDEGRHEVEAAVRQIIKQGQKVWIDEESGFFEYPYYTDLWISKRK